MHDPTPANSDLCEARGSHRLFFALWPDDATRVAIAAAAARLRIRAHGGRWTAVDRYHLTLQFLGTWSQLPDSLVHAACTAAAGVRAPGFSITLDCIGSFRTRSHLWWLGCQRPEPLLRLREVLMGALENQGVPAAPAAFVPHVSLVRGARRPPPRDAGIVPIVWPVHGFALIHSESGARDAYRVLDNWPLASG